jgi:hypothetical protein
LNQKRPNPDSLDRFAAWVVGEENPTFGGSIAARMWLRVMGAKLHKKDNEEFLDSKDSVTGALSGALMKLIKGYEYDLRAFQQTLMLTKTFALKSAPDAEASFHGLLGPALSRG